MQCSAASRTASGAFDWHRVNSVSTTPSPIAYKNKTHHRYADLIPQKYSSAKNQLKNNCKEITEMSETDVQKCLQSKECYQTDKEITLRLEIPIILTGSLVQRILSRLIMLTVSSVIASQSASSSILLAFTASLASTYHQHCEHASHQYHN